MGKLDAAEIDKYFAEHLPYRVRIMLAHYKMTRTSWNDNPAWVDACFVASLVTGRLFLNVLGVGKRAGALTSFSPEADDVTATDLGGELLDPAALSTAERLLLFDFLRMADKAAAHFTIPITHDWTMTHDVIRWIHQHLQVNLYDHTGRGGLEPMD